MARGGDCRSYPEIFGQICRRYGTREPSFHGDRPNKLAPNGRRKRRRAKTTLAREKQPGKTVPGLAYRIKTNKNYRIDDSSEVGQVVWDPGIVDMHADDALAEANEQQKPGPDPDKQADAETWLKDLLGPPPP